jgi:hypothetical protein
MNCLLNRPVLCLWRHILPVPLQVAFIVAIAIFTAFTWGPVSLRILNIFSGSLVFCFFMVFNWRNRWYFRLAYRVRYFRTISNYKVILHYPSAIHNTYDMSLILDRCTNQLDRVAERFGTSLGYKVAVYLFPLSVYPNEIDGLITGRALWSGNVYVVSGYAGDEEILRHEYSHLFAFQWYRSIAPLLVPPLLSEGLCVWAQETGGGQPIDAYAKQLLANPELTLTNLLNPRFFRGHHERDCYPLAGSFCGFLIRHYGLEQFRKFYRRCNGYRFQDKFKNCYGMTIEMAESRWRDELLQSTVNLKPEVFTGDRLGP